MNNLKSVILHLRIPFSLLLSPVFFFSAILVENLESDKFFYLFVIIHLLAYPASNGFNSYYDRDTKSIGMLKKPPKVNRNLLIVSLILEVVSIIGGFLLDFTIGIAVLITTILSMLYSHPSFRIKKRPYSSWFLVGIFQGFVVYFFSLYALDDQNLKSLLQNPTILWGGLIMTLSIWATYPLSQVYQHKEDQERGDLTISRVLGIKGTFIFSFALSIVYSTNYFIFLYLLISPIAAATYLFITTPGSIYFLHWVIQVWGNQSAADFSKLKNFSLLLALPLNIFLLTLLFFN